MPFIPVKTVRKTQLLLLSAIGLLTLIAVIVAIDRSGLEAGAVDRSENGLLTTVAIKGQLAPMKLVERMAYYGVPGMSIAVINKGVKEAAGLLLTIIPSVHIRQQKHGAAPMRRRGR